MRIEEIAMKPNGETCSACIIRIMKGTEIEMNKSNRDRHISEGFIMDKLYVFEEFEQEQE